ncbi:MAG: hypothetical protein PF961_23105 [Planctomycetota bacterium]|jgi:hypothetical protein|nr:hypothetical protein [Planctomycetota bacterium]
MGISVSLLNSFARRCSGIAMLAAAVLAAPAGAEEGKDLEVYDQMQAELKAMVESRDTELFELDFSPMEMDRVLLKNGSDVEAVYHYLTFRLRNRVSDNAKFLIEHATGFNEVMDGITKEYEGVTFLTERGPELITDAANIEDRELATIVERTDLRVRSRGVNLTALISDENGSRFRLFDEKPGEGPQEAFNFEDRGETRYSTSYQRVREAIEEVEGRRLLSVHEIRDLKLPPYDATKRDEEGTAQGEVFGVLIFDRLPTGGDVFTIHVQGLSNKLRFKVPDHAVDEVGDYFNSRILRRTYSVTVKRPGDEYFLDQVSLELGERGWTWYPAFQRLSHRATLAYAEYFLNNIALEKETNGAQGPVLHDEAVAKSFWEYYDRMIVGMEQRFEGKIAEIEAEKDVTRGYYEQMIAEDAIDGEDIAKRLQARIDQLDARATELAAQLETLRDKRPDFKASLEEQ